MSGHWLFSVSMSKNRYCAIAVHLEVRELTEYLLRISWNIEHLLHQYLCSIRFQPRRSIKCSAFSSVSSLAARGIVALFFIRCLFRDQCLHMSKFIFHFRSLPALILRLDEICCTFFPDLLIYDFYFRDFPDFYVKKKGSSEIRRP